MSNKKIIIILVKNGHKNQHKYRYSIKFDKNQNTCTWILVKNQQQISLRGRSSKPTPFEIFSNKYKL